MSRRTTPPGSAFGTASVVLAAACALYCAAAGGAPLATTSPDAAPAAATPPTTVTPAAAASTTPNPSPAAPVASAADAPRTYAEAYAAFRRQFDARQFEASVVPAQQAADLAAKEFGPESEERQVSLMNLATAQYLAGDLTNAEASYLRVIEIVESSGKPQLERLARANAGLANTYYAGKRYDIAVPRFERAVGLSRRSEGLLNERQVPLLEKYIDTLTQLGRYEDALQVQRYALRIAMRKYGDRDPRLAPTLEKLGRWYARVGAYDPARSTIKLAISIVETAIGPNAPELVGPLTALAECGRLQLEDPAQQKLATQDTDRATMFHDPTPGLLPYSPGATAAEAQKSLERAAAIVDAHPDTPPTQFADVHTQLGDWFTTHGDPGRALPQYQIAWRAASHATYENRPLVQGLFGRPVLLYYARPESWNRYASHPREEIEIRVAEVDLTVDQQGHVRDAKLVQDSGDARRGESTVKAANSARYRPRLVDGQPVETPGVRFSQPWVVLLAKAEPEKSPEKPPEATDGKAAGQAATPATAESPTQPSTQPPAQAPAAPAAPATTPPPP